MDVQPVERPLAIAIVYSRIPVPMRRADQMTVAHLLSFLKSRGHSVDLYCINTGAAADEADLEWLYSVCRSVHLYRHNWLSIMSGLMRVATRRVPVQVGLFSHPKQRHDVRDQISSKSYDVVYTYYFRSAEIARGLGRKTGSPSNGSHAPATFLAMQLSQTLNTRRIAKNAPNLANKLFYELESRMVARYEARIWREFTHTVLIGPRDLDEIQNTCRAQRQPLIDNHIFGAHGTDVSRFTPRTHVPVRQNHLVFSGVMRTPTNVQAVQWFAKKVWPIVRASLPEATWTIAGREPAAEVKELAELPGVEVTGTIPDPSIPIAEAAVCINPMQAGGGMQNKLLEYLATGKPVVATTVANEGINARAGEHLLVADAPEEFASAVVSLLRSEQMRTHLGRAAREFVLKNWTWEVHFMELEKAFYGAIPAVEEDSRSESVASGVLVEAPQIAG